MTKLLLIAYFLVLLYGWFFLPGRMQAGEGEQRVYLWPSQTTVKMVRKATQSEDNAVFFWRTFFVNVGGNIIWFLPLGILLPSEVKLIRHLLNLLVFAFLFSLLAETLQYIFAVGIFDIDDVILNTLGAALGWGVFKIIFRNKYSVLTKK